MTSGQIVGKMDTQKQLNVPLHLGIVKEVVRDELRAERVARDQAWEGVGQGIVFPRFSGQERRFQCSKAPN